jgi:hypothetical protein
MPSKFADKNLRTDVPAKVKQTSRLTTRINVFLRSGVPSVRTFSERKQDSSHYQSFLASFLLLSGA